MLVRKLYRHLVVCKAVGVLVCDSSLQVRGDVRLFELTPAVTAAKDFEHSFDLLVTV